MSCRTFVRMEHTRGDVSVEGLGGAALWARAVVAEVKGSTVGLSAADLAADVRGLQEVLSALSAAQTVRLAQYAAREEERNGDGAWRVVDRGVGHVTEWAGDDVAPMLGMAPSMATKRVHTAAKLAADLPVTLRAMADGWLDEFRAQIVAEESVLADREACAAVEEIIHPAVLGDTPGAVRRRVRKALASIDPEAVRQAAAKARVERHVRMREGQFPGMTDWFASLPAEDSAKCWAAIDELAHRMKSEDPGRGIDACRADALVDLVLARAEVVTTLSVAVPVEVFTTYPAPGTRADAASAATRDETATAAQRPANDLSCAGELADAGEPQPLGDVTGSGDVRSLGEAGGVEVPGVGLITPAGVARLARHFDTRILRMLIDSKSGVTREIGSRGYVPSGSIRAFVQARDGTCRFPGCRVRARRCQLDHVLAWPTGPTQPSNLLCLCRHHHRLKTFTRWRPDLALDGSVTWTDPFGDTWLNQPVDHRALDVA